MRIGFDVSQTGDRRAGCGQWADALVRALVTRGGDHTFDLYATFGDSDWDPDHARSTTAIPSPRVRRRLVGLSRADSAARWAGDEIWAHIPRPDVVHANNYAAPRLSGSTRLVCTLYDLVAIDEPDALPEQTRLICFDGLFHAAVRADLVVAISRHTRDRFRALFPHYPGDRIHVVHPGSRFHAPGPQMAVEGLAPGRFLLTVGTREPRKGHDTLLAAWEQWGGSLPLVMAGGSGWLTPAPAPRDGLHVLGYVDDARLRWLYAHCTAFVYPSRYEGFGLPVIEAMTCGAPVITTAAASLSEAAGGAALVVPPGEPQALARALEAVVSDPARRDALRARGRAHAQGFTWERAADAVLALYAEVRERPRWGPEDPDRAGDPTGRARPAGPAGGT
jgi:glycosyltransferase involved in cell wall biosynthesis